MTHIATQSASRLGNVSSLAQLSAVLGEQTRVLSYWLYKATPSQKYIQYSIKKKNGGFRSINAPRDGLKRIQTKLARLLSEIYNGLEQQRANGARDIKGNSSCVLSHGFKDKYSIITNAQMHVGKRYVFNVDIEDFFPSITFGRVRAFFISDNNFRLNPAVATMVAQLVCFKNQLPQGAPTSPVISNLIGHILDVSLNKLAKAGGCSYTRYADDLTFSTNERTFPRAVARLVAGTQDRWVAGDGLLARVYAAGFRLNHDKTRMQLQMSRQEVTGLTVNQTANVSSRYYKTTRSMCDHLFTGGTCHEMVEGNWTAVPIDKLQGRMDFIYSVRRSRLKINIDLEDKKQYPIAYRSREIEFCSKQRSFTNLYKNLLNYDLFHGSNKPTIIGEGVTDALYIQAAIKTIGTMFPKLYKAVPDEEVLVRFYKHSEKRKFYQIGEGAPQLKTFISDYTALMAPFKTKPKNAVIVIVDSDSEGEGVLKAAGNRWKQDVTVTAPFYHLVSNLYILKIPLPGSSTSASIEDLFDPIWLAAQDIEGRKFTKKNDFNSTTYFGKTELVGKIVRPKRLTIDWTGFQPLLGAIQGAILDYEHKLAVAP